MTAANVGNRAKLIFFFKQKNLEIKTLGLSTGNIFIFRPQFQIGEIPLAQNIEIRTTM